MEISLADAHVGQVYYVSTVEHSPRVAKLRELGFVSDHEVELASLTESGAIVKVADTRLALSVSLLTDIKVKDARDKEALIGLSELTEGQTGVVRLIEAEPMTKHRLMDMGITRGVKIFVRKLAPLGDPMELHLRGYALSLRKSDALAIKVVKEDEH